MNMDSSDVYIQSNLRISGIDVHYIVNLFRLQIDTNFITDKDTHSK